MQKRLRKRKLYKSVGRESYVGAIAPLRGEKTICNKGGTLSFT